MPNGESDLPDGVSISFIFGARYVFFCLVILRFEELEQEPASADAWSIGHVESEAEWKSIFSILEGARMVSALFETP